MKRIKPKFFIITKRELIFIMTVTSAAILIIVCFLGLIAKIYAC